MGRRDENLEQKSRIIVDIYGQQYAIVGTETTAHIQEVARRVDEKMRAFSQREDLDTSKLAVLTAVNFAHDYMKLLEEYEYVLDLLKKEEAND